MGKAQAMADTTLSALSGSGNLSEKGSKQGIESVDSMTKDPDMLNEGVSKKALGAIDGTTGAVLSAQYPEAATRVVSNALSQSKAGAKKEEPTKDKLTEQNNAVRKVSKNVMGASSVANTGGEGVAIETPLLQGKKDKLDLTKTVATKTKNGGLMMDPEVLGRILIENGLDADRFLAEDETLSASVLQTTSNTLNHDNSVKNGSNSGVASIGISAGKKSVPIETDEGLIISYKSGSKNNNPDVEQKCMFWKEEIQAPSSEGCVFLNMENGLITCKCTHLTDFFGMLVNKFRSKFANGNWGNFGPQK